MEQPQLLVGENFPLFKPSKIPAATASAAANENPNSATTNNSNKQNIDSGADEPATDDAATFADLGLADWAVKTCKELGMRAPRRVQQQCIPRVLEGRHVLGIDETGSGKTAAFALPILHRLSEHPFGVCALVVTPTRELAFQLAEQFRAFGSSLRLRIAVVVGGMDMLKQTKELVARPHIVIATPGRMKFLLQDNPDIPPVFSRTKVMILMNFVLCIVFWSLFMCECGGI